MIDYVNFQFESYGNKSFITYNIEDRDSMDHVELEMMRLNDITGLLPFNLLQSDGHLKCCYDITSMAKLSFLYESQVNKQKLFQIFEQIALCVEEAEDYMLDINHFVLNPEYIFVNLGDMGVRLALIPQEDVGMFGAVSLRDFLRKVMNEISYDYSGNGGEFYINISNYLNSTREVRPKELREMLYRCMGITSPQPRQKKPLASLPRNQSAATSETAGFRQGRSMDSQSWKLGEKPQTDHNTEKRQKEAAAKKGFFKKNRKPEKEIPAAAGVEIPGRGFSEGKNLGMEIPGDGFSEGKGTAIEIPGSGSGGINIPGGMGEAPAILPGQAHKKKNPLFQKMGGPIPKSAPKPPPNVQESPLPEVSAPNHKLQQTPVPKLKPQQTPVPKPQQMADAIAGTVLMDDAAEERPFLEKAKTGERIYLDYSRKSEIRIGRNPEFVDHVVDNPTVGRVHITIIHDGNGYFVIDVNSKNGTFIDRRRIQSNAEEPLHDGCQLRIGTEEFYFYTH